MLQFVKYIYHQLDYLFAEHVDPRVAHLPLVGNPIPVFTIIALYLVIVLHYGPKWMKHRKPYDLRCVMCVYNAAQVISNIGLLLYGFKNSYLRKEFSFTCQPADPTNTQLWMKKLLYITYGYYITKYLDLLDTLFFILRKKDNQITFLHVYHHAGMVFAVFVFITFLPGSHSTMLGIINLFVHTVMYSYYFITSIYNVEKGLWWKRHITQLQLMQFGYLIIHFFLVIVNNYCQHPYLIAFIGFTQNLFMFALFFDFYYKEYIKKPRQQQRLSNELQQTTAATITAATVANAKAESSCSESVNSRSKAKLHKSR